MKQKFTVLIQQDEDGTYTGKVLELQGCVSQGDTRDELLHNIREAIELCLEVDVQPDAVTFVGVEQLKV